MGSTQSPLDADFVRQLTAHQSRLHAYIYSLVRNSEQAWDVLQETNMVLWREHESYDHSRPFLPWAFAIAFNQVRAARQKISRDRLAFHDQQTLDALSQTMIEQAGDSQTSEMEIALDQCIKQLSDDHQQVVERYYRHGHSLDQIGKASKRTANTVGVTLHRVRQALARCIEQTLGQIDSAESATDQ